MQAKNYPQTKGQVKSMNQRVIRISRVQSTKSSGTGYSSYSLLFERLPSLPINTLLPSHSKLSQSYSEFAKK